MKNLFLLAILLLSLVACSEKKQEGVEPKRRTEIREARNFSHIDWTGTGNLFISQGNKEEIKLEANEDVLPDIITEVKDGTLHIEQKPQSWIRNFLTETNFNAYISFKNIESISLAGKGTLKGEKEIQSKNLTIKVSGSGNVDLALETENLTAIGMGSSNYHLKGKTDEQNVQINGSGIYNAAQLLSQKASIDIRGSGEANVNVQNQLNVIITGKGTVRYIGKPQISQTIFGSGIVEELKQ